MINMYQELTQALAANGKTMDDIQWVGTKEFYVPTAEFLTRIQELYYDQERGCAEVATDLIIIGVDWGLRRKYDYKGNEDWEYIELPVKPDAVRSDINNFTIRELLDPMGFRVYNDACVLTDLNPEPA